jgi:hypothetical protein
VALEVGIVGLPGRDAACRCRVRGRAGFARASVVIPAPGGPSLGSAF